MIDWRATWSPDQSAAALDLARMAWRQRPDEPASHVALARVLEHCGNHAELRELLEKACERFPSSEALQQQRIRLMMKLGAREEALAAARPWMDRPWAAKMFLKFGRSGEAAAVLTAAESVLEIADPADPDLLEFRAAKYRSQPTKLLRACEQVLSAAPAEPQALYYKLIALAQLGRGEEAFELLGTRFVHSANLLDGTGANVDLRQIGAEVRSNETLHADPLGHATRHGVRTQVFPTPKDRASLQLLASIRSAIDDYAAGLSGDHPFVGARPSKASLTAWALLFSSDSHQELHIHPGRWLTGVFYVEVPGGEGSGGALRIGGLPEWAEVTPPWHPIEIRPVPGQLVLFPSHMPHDTVPTGSDAQRLSIAFDVRDAHASP